MNVGRSSNESGREGMRRLLRMLFVIDLEREREKLDSDWGMTEKRCSERNVSIWPRFSRRPDNISKEGSEGEIDIS